MALIYIKGTPGSGKSTIRHTLEKRGHEAHDADDKDMGGPYNIATGLRVTYPETTTEEWFATHRYLLIPEAVQELHDRAKTKNIFLCGTSSNEDDLWYLFDQVLFLNMDEATLKHRIASRTNSDYGKLPHELKLILEKYHADCAKRDRLGLTTIDATQPLEKVVDDVLRLTTN